MTSDAATISVRIPARLQACIPAAGKGRSRFIIEALEEKAARAKPVAWRPTTGRGHRLAALLKAGEAERGPHLSLAELEQEIRERKGRQF
jgi:hypothetical protein